MFAEQRQPAPVVLKRLRRRDLICFAEYNHIQTTMTAAEHSIPRQFDAQQVGALPFSITEAGQTRVLLVTTRGRRDWIIPKGWAIPRLTLAASAAQEAYEEAGLVGTIVGEEPFGSFIYRKGRDRRIGLTLRVSVFLFAVEYQLRKWPEKRERETAWFSPEEASARVASPGLALLLRTAAEVHSDFVRVELRRRRSVL